MGKLARAPGAEKMSFLATSSQRLDSIFDTRPIWTALRGGPTGRAGDQSRPERMTPHTSQMPSSAESEKPITERKWIPQI